ncbi:MAG TPA: metallopeptidase TldD-related protein [Terriglobales bacterium]|nr:metallopeptidase TldD-related protein [Terriglobales bacterium]
MMITTMLRKSLSVPPSSNGRAHPSAKKQEFAIVLALLITLLVPSTYAQPKDVQLSADDDPVLQAMRTELDRSKSALKLEGMAAPYYIDYHITDMDTHAAEAAFGAVRTDLRVRFRFLRVVVRVGDYKQDSFFGQGQGVMDLMPLDNDVVALRHQIWLATDNAYKAATEALTAKQAKLKQYNVDQPVDDFARAEPVVSIGPLAKLDFDSSPWNKMLQDTSALYKTDPQIESFDSSLNFAAVNRYFVSSEGAVVRGGQTVYDLRIAGTTQAADGMRLDRSRGYEVTDIKELPSQETLLADTANLISTLKQLRDAPIADEEYRGPVLFSADAASTVFSDLVGDNILGLKPDLGQPARTKGAFAASYKSRVLPDFLSVVDDPTLASMNRKSLMGKYDVDDEGVKATSVSVIENGKLVNYLMGREPIRDFPSSNGHGRARVPQNFPGPSLGNMIVHSSESSSPENLKKKLIEICQQREIPYGYYVETMGPQRVPRLLYKVWVKDGHEELVRGAIFGDLDTRTLRNDLIAVGNDVNIENHPLNIPHSIVNPSILFDELEVKRANANKDTLPEYPAPTVAKK